MSWLTRRRATITALWFAVVLSLRVEWKPLPYPQYAPAFRWDELHIGFRWTQGNLVELDIRSGGLPTIIRLYAFNPRGIELFYLQWENGFGHRINGATQ